MKPPATARVFHFKAASVPFVTPIVVPPGTELVELVTAGIIHFRLGGDDLRLGSGALFWHIAGEQTIHRTEADAPYECVAVSFPVPLRRPRPTAQVSFMSDPQKVRDLGVEFLRAYHDESTDLALFSRYARARLLWEAHLGALGPAVSARPAAIEAALATLEARFSEHTLGVGDLSRAAAISEPHLHALFRQHLRQTPHQYLVARRIREARWLLSSTAQAIKSISADCGFLNVETFYRAFGKHTGATPQHFRRSHSLPILGQR